jgi:hypothetical protein
LKAIEFFCALNQTTTHSTMKHSPLIILLLLFFQVHAQPFFGNYYKNTAANYAATPCIARCYDGSIIGTSTIDGPSNSFKLFKLADDGTMLWQRRIELSVPIYIPFQVCALRDSSIAILISPQGAGDFIIVRCDLNGQILSVYNYGNTFSDALFIRPFGNGGVLSAAGLGIVMMDASGNIVHNYRFPFVSINSVEEKSPGIFTCIGQRGNPRSDLLLFDIDTSGNISNAYTYPLTGDSIYMYSDCPSKLIAKSPGGGVYCIRNLGDNPLQKFFVSYFNSNNQPVWFRIVEYPDMKCKQILADRNNGCFVTAELGLSPYMPAIFKFDSTGTLEWTRLLGDSSNANMKYFSIYDLTPDENFGWHFSLNKNNNYIFHSDSAFSTFCSFETFQPVITGITPGVLADSLSAITVTSGTMTTLTATSYPLNIFQYDACTDIQLNVASFEKVPFDLFPNPASEKVKLQFRNEMKSAHMELYNSHGSLLRSEDISGLSSNEVDVENLPDGIYLFRIIDSTQHFEKKLLIQH